LVAGWSALLRGQPLVIDLLRLRVPAILVIVGGCVLLIVSAGPWNHRPT
jgi:hypothetical protein